MGHTFNVTTPLTEDELERYRKAFEDIEATAYHESGHAVIGTWLRFPCKYVTIMPEEEHLAGKRAGRRETERFLRVRHGILRTPYARERAGELGVMLVSGIVAESKYTGRRLGSFRNTTGKLDYEFAMALSERILLKNPWALTADTQEACLRLWEQQAVSMLNSEAVWKAVEDVANELLVSETLSGTEVEEIIRGSMLSSAENPT